ncbi:SH3-like domain-containing protein [Siccirubricoccus soli]|uniref:SH3-like domain-containing protein n=1 Tax=Siccirubricoccus soli TaxID=2899147 RepID=UPI002095A688|nr:SH3-like domain-containing protein [Siccirubricoccus soli]MCP2686140.1 nitrile hydratase subunit beta [Siccirubricoccus soli]
MSAPDDRRAEGHGGLNRLRQAVNTFQAGDRVRVKYLWPERHPQPSGLPSAHIRTPHYLRGRTGTVQAVLGSFRNPEDLAFGRPAPQRVLYHVLFDQPPIWNEGEAGDSLLVEIFEHWLEPATNQEKAA